MNKTAKSRLLYVLQCLWQSTDAEHYVTTAEILAYLKDNGIVCDRKTIPGDIEKLRDIGIDVEEERSREMRYSLSSHLFTLPELKLLIDAVESSKFITVKKSTELVEKLSQMSSRYQSMELKRNLYISERVKPINEQIYYLVWNEDHYYVVGYSDKHNKIVSFRVDRMKEIDILPDDAAERPGDFNLADFTRQVFDMYDGQKETVTLFCNNDMMNYVIDRFGDEVKTSPVDCEHFEAVAEVSVSQTFFAWVFQFNGDIKIIEPEPVVVKYREMLRNALEGRTVTVGR